MDINYSLLMTEVKWSEKSPSPNFKIFEEYFPKVRKVQIVEDLQREKTYHNGLEIRLAYNWLADLSLA